MIASAQLHSHDVSSMRSAVAPCYTTCGKLRLHNTLELAYKLWSNLPDPVAVQAFQPDATEVQIRQQCDEQLNILATHGRHDNAATFDHILPQIFESYSKPSEDEDAPSRPKRINVLCLEFAGHGLSDWRPTDGTYGIVYHVSDLHQVLALLNWREYIYLGHSLGAIVGIVLCGAQGLMLPTPAIKPPPMLLGMILLDPFKPECFALKDTDGNPAGDDAYAKVFHSQGPDGSIALALESRYRLLRQERKLYSLKDAVVTYMQHSASVIEGDSVMTLMSRGVKYVKRRKGDITGVTEVETSSSDAPFDPQTEEAGYVFTHDPLIDATLPTELSRSQLQTAARTIHAPSLCVHFRTREISVDKPFIRHIDALLRGTIFDLHHSQGVGEVVELCGDHHLHLDEPEEVASTLQTFLQQAWMQHGTTREEAKKRLEFITKTAKQAKERATLTEKQALIDQRQATSQEHIIAKAKL